MRVKGLTFDFLLKATGGKLNGRRRRITGISVDSRTIKKGEVFFAIRGEVFDGHAFCKDALKNGASCVVVKKDCGLKDGYIKVQDTLAALGDVARRWRQQFTVRCVAITGTSGKTTTRRIAAHLLKGHFLCCESMKNYNNLVGLPFAVLQIEDKTEIAIIEMAMNRRGEIKRLAQIADPDMGVITNVGRGHLEFLGSLGNVAAAKAELLQHLKQRDVAVLNADDPYVMKIQRKTKASIITYGIDNKADFIAGSIQMGKQGSTFSVNGESGFCVPLLGKINIYNSLAAIAVSSLLGLGSKEMKRRLRTVRTEKFRLNRISIAGVTLYDDSYNANPDSMAAAIRIAAREEGKRKIACLGDMLELGKQSPVFHREVGRSLRQHGFDFVFLYGPLSRSIQKGFENNGFSGKVFHFLDREKMIRKLVRTAKKGDIVLIKASHNNRFDFVADALIKSLKGRT